MSVSTSAVIMVGLPYEELAAFLGQPIVDQMIEDSVVEVSSNYYDSSPKENIVGYEITSASGDYTELEGENLAELLMSKDEFKLNYGIEPKVYLTLKIY